MIHQFNHLHGVARYWVNEKAGRKRILGNEYDDGAELNYQRFRLGFRRIGRPTDERTMIATIVPAGVFTSESLTISTGYSLTAKDLLALVAIFNSFVFDYSLRMRVSANISMFFVYQLRVPRLKEGHQAYQPIVTRSARLVCTTEEFAPLWSAAMESPWSRTAAAYKEEDRSLLRAELDGLITHVYGLTKEDFVHILSTFPVVPQGMKDAALEAYRRFAPRPGDPEILALIGHGESHSLEFKSTARWNLRTGAKDQEMEKEIRKAVAGFLNSEGGALLIGVADDGSVVGLEPDFQTLKKKDRDGFGLFLTDLLLNQDRDLAPCIRTSFHSLDGKEVCRISITKSPRPVYMKEGNDPVFYIRIGNSTRRLNLKEAVEYVKTHWG